MNEKEKDATQIATASSDLPEVDIMTAEFKASAFSFYAKLRESAPVYQTHLKSGQAVWLISRYDDVTRALKDERLVKDKHNAGLGRRRWQLAGMLGTLQSLERNMLDVDPPDHTRLRGLVHKGFTPRLIERLRPRIQELTEGLLAKAREQGQIDLIRDFALPIPVIIISEMLGIPTCDVDRIHRWSNALVQSDPTAAGLAELKQFPKVWGFLRYIRQNIEKKRRQPEDDLISALVQAEEEGDRLKGNELVAMIFLLVVAGHETTTNLIGNGALALLQHPDQLERLRKDPTLYKSAIEELLRFYSPVELATERYTREPVEICGKTIPPGQLVCASIGSANRDPKHFENPEALDVGRKKNRHLSFGEGIHFCIGAPLARLEGQIAMQALVEGLPGLRLAIDEDQLRWNPGLNLRGLKELPVAFEK